MPGTGARGAREGAAVTDYRLIDEPSPRNLAGYVVRPYWIAVGLVLAGAWLAFPWLVLNAHALGSPTKAREMGLAVGYFVIASGLAALIYVLVLLGLPAGAAPYLMGAVLIVKVTLAYWIVFLQTRTFALYEALGGAARSPAAVLLAGLLLREAILPEPTSVLWLLVRGVLR